jgi:hypothetical protein
MKSDQQQYYQLVSAAYQPGMEMLDTSKFLDYPVNYE